MPVALHRLGTALFRAMLVAGSVGIARGSTLANTGQDRHPQPDSRGGDRLNRRELALLVGGALLAAHALPAQQKTVPVVGFLSIQWPDPAAPLVAAFRRGLGESGYVEGQTVAIEYRWAEGSSDRLPALAANLVRRNVDVIATNGIASTLAAKNATSEIPIVFLIGTDPVGDRLIDSLARPGGNLTGFTVLNVETMAKHLELLSELVPQAGVIALLVNPNNPNTEGVIDEFQRAAQTKGIQTGFSKPAAKARLRPPSPPSSNCQPARSLLAETRCSAAGVSSWWHWHPAMPSPRSIGMPCTRPRAAS